MNDVELRQRTLNQYRALMGNVRARFEIIDGLKLSFDAGYPQIETAAFHLRKSLEGVAFGCLVAMENGLKAIPRDPVGQWNADRIFAKVAKRQPLVFPFAARREEPSPDSTGVQHHVTTNEKHSLSLDQVRSIYRRTHRWLHEINPYVPLTDHGFDQLRENLLGDIRSVWGWLLHHLIAAEGEVFLAILKTDQGGIEVSAATAHF